MDHALKNILVATDFSEEANNIINLSVELCKYHQATMHLLHVKESRYILDNPEPGRIASLIANEIDQEARDRLYEIYEAILREHDISVQIHMPTGIPFDEICEAASAMPIDLIVIGKHGASGVNNTLMGTTAYNVIKYALKPVLVVPGNYDGTGFRNILFPIKKGQDVKTKYELIKPFLQGPGFHIHIGIFYGNAMTDGNSTGNELTGIIAEMEHNGIYCTNAVYNNIDAEGKLVELCDLLQSDLIVINTALDYKCTQFCIRPYTRELAGKSKVPVLCLRNCIDITDESSKEEPENAAYHSSQLVLESTI